MARSKNTAPMRRLFIYNMIIFDGRVKNLFSSQ